jgi:hypothetical protein
MEELQHGRIGQELFESRRALLARCDLDDLGRPVAARELHDAKPVAPHIEAERLGVDRDDRAEVEFRRQIAAMQASGHVENRPSGLRMKPAPSFNLLK